MLCGCPEMLGDGSAMYKLPSNRFAFLVRDALPAYTRDEIAAWNFKALARWASVADIEGRRIFSMSELRDGEILNEITVADLGTNGTLADQQLPQPGVFIYRMRINSRIKWIETDGIMQPGTADPVRTIGHEDGHFLGFQHFPTSLPKEWMEPRILQDVIGPQPTEAKIAVDWFGPPKPANQPTPSPGTAPWEFRINPDGSATVKKNGVLQRLSPSPFSSQ